MQSADDRTLALVRKRGSTWQTVRLATVPQTMALGWPGLALDAKGLPIVAYSRWNSLNLNTQLQLVRLDAKGRPSTQNVTRGGFPQSSVPPPAAPVLVGGRAHVVEAYGFHTVTGAFEWYPDGKTWTGRGLDVSRGEFPIGPVLASLLRGRLYAAWSMSMAAFDAAPVTLAERATNASSEFVLDRALTTALALPSGGAEVAANQWVTSDELGLGGDGVVWAGTVVSGGEQVGLDGWIGGLAVAPKSGRDILLERGGNLEWYRSPAKLTTRVSVRTFPGADGVTIEGSVDGSSGGRVTIFRERANGSRQAAGTAQLSAAPSRSPTRPAHGRSFTERSTRLLVPGFRSRRSAHRSSSGTYFQPRRKESAEMPREPVAHPFPQVELMLALEVAVPLARIQDELGLAAGLDRARCTSPSPG